MPEISFTLEVEASENYDVYCEACGAGLCGATTIDNQHKRIYVEPCKRCMEAAKDDGYNAGDEEGYNKGYADGMKDAEGLNE